MRRAACLFALLVVLSPLSATAAATVGPASTDGSASADADSYRPSNVLRSDGVLQTTPPDPNTVIRIHLQPDRDARWTVQFRYRLETPNETAAFRHLRERFVAGEAVAGPNIAMFRTAAERASTAAGRKMEITSVNRTGSIDGDVGTLTLRFTWTNFLERGPGSTLRLGDAFRTPNGGRWISSLESGQRVVIVTPDGYTVNSTSFQLQLRNNSVIIDGPRSLEEEELVVTYRETSRSNLPWGLIGGGALLLALVVAAVLYRYLGHDEGDESSPAVPAGESTDGGVGVDDPVAAVADSATDESDPEREPADDAGDTDVDEEGAVDPSLLSDEERVERLLERNGGRMKQATIVNETGWSDAKVSQLLSAMTDEGRVEKLRLGRENLISLPDADEEGSA